MISDGLVDTVFQDRAIHIPVNKPPAKNPTVAMVQRCNTNIGCFFFYAQPLGGRSSPPPTNIPVHQGHNKRPRIANQSSTPDNTPPINSNPTITITTDHPSTQETTLAIRTEECLVVSGTNVASSSTPPSVGWQSSFNIGDKPLPLDSHLQTCRSGEVGRVADSLGQALFLLNDMKFQ